MYLYLYKNTRIIQFVVQYVLKKYILEKSELITIVPPIYYPLQIYLFIHDRRTYLLCLCMWYAYYTYVVVCMCIGNENRLFRGREPVSPAEEFLHLSQPNLRAVRAHLQQQNIRITYTRPAQVRCDYE